jgi:hypothetical protein
MCPKCRLNGLKSFEEKFRCDNCGAVFIQVNYSTPAFARTRESKKKQVAMNEKFELEEIG